MDQNGTNPETRGAAQRNAELHLCNNYRHILFAIADMTQRSAFGTIVYLEDHTPLTDVMKHNLQNFSAQIDVIFSKDAAEEARFANLPVIFPDLMRRNLRVLKGVFLTKATRWRLPCLKDRMFQTGYLYHPGFFTAKPATAHCDKIIMRESGLNNYKTFSVPFPKSLARLIAGLPPFQQTWGEEPWVDSIEVTYPERLPPGIRKKAQKRTFPDVLSALNPAQMKRLTDTFAPESPKIAPGSKPRALILSQPLDLVGLCTWAQKQTVYQSIADALQTKGMDVYHKHHPNDVDFAVQGSTPIRADFPIELWSVLDLPQFFVATALCSASVDDTGNDFARRSVQLMPLQDFTPDGVQTWISNLPSGLAPLDSLAAQ